MSSPSTPFKLSRPPALLRPLHAPSPRIARPPLSPRTTFPPDPFLRRSSPPRPPDHPSRLSHFDHLPFLERRSHEHERLELWRGSQLDGGSRRTRELRVAPTRVGVLASEATEFGRGGRGREEVEDGLWRRVAPRTSLYIVLFCVLFTLLDLDTLPLALSPRHPAAFSSCYHTFGGTRSQREGENARASCESAFAAPAPVVKQGMGRNRESGSRARAEERAGWRADRLETMGP